jgi:GxxExxY protein
MKNDYCIDDKMEPNPELNFLTNEIIGAAMEVHTRLKAGLIESLYQKALEIELTQRNIPFQRQVKVPVFYRGQQIGYQRLDFIIAEKVVLEIKTIEQFAPVHTSQMVCYLRITGCKLGLIINFRVSALKEGIKRVAL